MTMHDPFVRTSLGGWAVRVRWRLGRRGLVPRARERGGPDAPVRQRYRRQLSRIERHLAEDAPALKSMFAMFNQLSAGEQPVTVERVPARGWSSPEWRRQPALVAVLLALAAIVTLCLTLSTKVHTVVRPCVATTATAATAVAATAGAQVRDLNCHAYANK
jgi:hypothetical protein